MAAFTSGNTGNWLASTSPTATYDNWYTVVPAEPREFFRTPRERDEWVALVRRWKREAIAQARLDWLRARRLLGWDRRETSRPRARVRSVRRPWPVAVTAWRLQEARLRKGSRLTMTAPRRAS